MPTLWQEVGQEHTNRPKEERILFRLFGCPACDHKSQKNTGLGLTAELGGTAAWFAPAGVYWMVKDKSGKEK